MNKEALISDKKLLASLEDQYEKTRRAADSIRAFVSDLNFEDNVPDQQERFLMMDQLHVYEQVQANLINRIRFYRDRVKMQEDKEKIAEHLEHEQREFMPILDKMIKTCQLPAFSNINQEKFEAFQKGNISLQEFLESVPCNEAFLKAVIQYLSTAQLNHCDQDTRRHDEAATKLCDLLVKGRLGEKCAKCGGYLSCGLGVKEGEEILCFNCANQITIKELQQALDEYRATYTHHCGQDVQDADDACCQARAGRVGYDAAPAASQTCESLYKILGYQVICFLSPGEARCDQCQFNPNDPEDCVKVELVGGYYICLAPLPNSIVTE